MILEHWDTIENLHGPSAKGAQRSNGSCATEPDNREEANHL
jgi:hypothetical protein